MKNLWILCIMASVSAVSCRSADNFTASADTDANTRVANSTRPTGSTSSTSVSTDGTVVHNVPGSSATVNGREISDPVFLMEVASGNILQISLGRLALERATHAEVKQFAQMMIDHHTKDYTELKALATELNVSLPLTMFPMHQAVNEKLAKLTGKQFDEEYMEEMEAIHERDVAIYAAVSNGGQTVRVKAFAIRTLPILRKHLFEADRIEDLLD